ncbi:hypothetical protein A33O_11078 [Nitratireductor aquibiodomus RA22]|jgi:hypothetical protein|uniref:Uncharacterized protein n=2 Tax=Nitratireductor aquibiodomus TaxID=204799 RepID=A0A1H4JG01_9HYPH|nr:hypothetical protein [Nitratireductor aquibiodomus]EIM74707.1 hypothetical protein A33O_11078 [Nitratireductor aquibiodomus RA22]SEB45230.1 hypothetical protein SAMN05216452_1348 [Nitratireductor aquibiodomus]
MDKQPHSPAREIIVANAIRAVANELRLIDVADYIAFIRLESLASVADIVESAAELYFMPGTLRLGHGCDAHVTWGGSPRISLDLELRPQGATVYFTLELSADNAGVEVNYVAFDNPSDDPEANSRYLADTLQASRIVRTERPLING